MTEEQNLFGDATSSQITSDSKIQHKTSPLNIYSKPQHIKIRTGGKEKANRKTRSSSLSLSWNDHNHDICSPEKIDFQAAKQQDTVDRPLNSPKANTNSPRSPKSEKYREIILEEKVSSPRSRSGSVGSQMEATTKLQRGKLKRQIGSVSPVTSSNNERDWAGKVFKRSSSFSYLSSSWNG